MTPAQKLATLAQQLQALVDEQKPSNDEEAIDEQSLAELARADAEQMKRARKSK